MKKRLTFFLLFSGVFVLGLFANSGQSLPWEGALQKILDALSGNTVKIIATAAMVICGILIAVTEGQAIKKVIWVVGGIALAVNASSFVLNFLGVSSGLVGSALPYVAETVKLL